MQNLDTKNAESRYQKGDFGHLNTTKRTSRYQKRRTPTLVGEDCGKPFYLQSELFCLQLSFFAYSPLRCFLDTLSHCKQRSLLASKEAPSVSKKAPIVSRKAEIVSKKAQKKLKLSTVSKKAPL